MSDIVERLRAHGVYDGPSVTDEAAAEISRLRAELAEAQRERDEIITKMTEGLERIERGALTMKAQLDQAERDRDAAKAEAERLREAAAVEEMKSATGSVAEAIKDLRRAGFTEAADLVATKTLPETEQIFRAALQEKSHD